MAGFLLIEDEEPFGTELLHNLVELGLSAERATEGGSALDLLRRKDYQGVILDLRLQSPPSPQGLQVLEWISKHKNEMAVVVVTGHAHLAFRALELGVDALLYKPVQAQHVLHYMMRAIELRQLRQENVRVKKIVSLAIGTHAPAVVFAALGCLTILLWRRLLPNDMFGLPLVFVILVIALLGSRRVSRLMLNFLGQKLEITATIEKQESNKTITKK